MENLNGYANAIVETMFRLLPEACAKERQKVAVAQGKIILNAATTVGVKATIITASGTQLGRDAHAKQICIIRTTAPEESR